MGFSSWFGGKKPPSAQRPPSAAMNPMQRLQVDYWTYKASEQRELLSRAEHLSWGDQLRLHHLNSLELLETGLGRKAFESDGGDRTELPPNAGAALRQTFAKLAAPESPYRPHSSVIWMVHAEPNQQRDPDYMGLVMNASITHLGALEVISLDSAGSPIAVEFIGISEVHRVVIGKPSLFRAARIDFDSDRPAMIVALPLLYGISWQSHRELDRDGTLTRFCCHQSLGDFFGSVAIGVGHQDFTLRKQDGSGTIFGLGSIQAIQTPLDMRDTSFDQRCRARGINPNEVRHQSNTTGN